MPEHPVPDPDPPAPALCLLVDPGPGDRRRLPDEVERLVAAVRDGAAPGILGPLVARGPDGTAMPAGELAGERDARILAHLLAQPEFTPLCDLVARLERWCRDRAARWPQVVAPQVLRVTNPDLFAPLLTECLVACAVGPAAEAYRMVGLRGAQYRALLDQFLTRLGRDLGSAAWPAGRQWRGPVVGLAANGGETHNGGQRVLRVDFAGGGRAAYKPRPVAGEALFLAPESSLFALLNQLPAESGAVRLPILPTWPGADAASPAVAGYYWQEWVDATVSRGVLRRADGLNLRGTVLEPAQAQRFWRRTGALAAVCFAFGVVDLHSENLLVGACGEDREPALYPIDLESYFTGTGRLSETGLVEAWDADDADLPADGGPGHHVGLETEARWCQPEAPSAAWWRTEDGGLELCRRRMPFGRTETRTVVADTAGREGYGPYLTAMLRGMFDAWTLLGRHRARIAGFLAEHRPRHLVRVIPRPTAEYARALIAPDAAAEQFDPAEVAQLRRGDVPYFVRGAAGGPLRCVASTGAFDTAEVALPAGDGSRWPPQPTVVDGDGPSLFGLGVAVRDAVAHVFDDVVGDQPALVLDDPAHGVRGWLCAPGEGQVSFDWPGQGRRITYRWQRAKLRVGVDELSKPVPAPPQPDLGGRIRARLLRLDRLDGAIRFPWAAGGFTDPAAAEKLRRLSEVGVGWLRTVIEEHGWPGRRLVGRSAAAAACRLLQHCEGEIGFRNRCLALLAAAAKDRDASWREVAYVTDSLLLAEDRPQRYGTKFQRLDGTLYPYPIEEPEHVDRRRAALGMEPLAEYTRRIRARFAPAGPGGDPSPARQAATGAEALR